MGLKDHLEDGTGHMLCLGLDLDYLHVDGAEQPDTSNTPTTDRNLQVLQGRGDVASSSSEGSSASSSAHLTCSSSSSSNFSEECVLSDSEDDRVHPGTISKRKKQLQDLPDLHQRPCLVSPPIRVDQALNPTDGGPLSPEPLPPSIPITECRNKVEFALKLGYSEDLVLLVLRKLGHEALINDILGELVKLGTKTEIEQQGVPNPALASSLMTPALVISSSPFTSSLDSCRTLCPSQTAEERENLRPVVVDGSNVAMSHGNKEVFSCQGIQLAVDWFLERGHQNITVFVPAWRKEQSRPDALITDQEILRRLEKEKILVFTPSRRVQGRRVVCYDDRFIVKLAFESDGIIVSNDNYRDLANEKPEWKKFIDQRLLMYSFVNDKFMPPDDPLGRHGPSLENFLRKRPVMSEQRKQPCPYGKKCTYGHKCKFYHPERGSQPQRAVADELRASAKISSVTSIGLVEHALMGSSQSSDCLERITENNQSKGEKEQNQSPQRAPTVMDDRFHEHTNAEDHTESRSSSVQGHSPPGIASSGQPVRWETPGAGGMDISRAIGAPVAKQAEVYPRSPEVSYSSMVKGYSSLSLKVEQSPERFFPVDLRSQSLLSDCSSDGSSDTFSPDSQSESPKCRHHHPRLHHPFPGQYGCASPKSGHHYHHHRFSVHQGLQRPQGVYFEEPSISVSSFSPSCSFKTSPAYATPQLQYPLMSGFSKEISRSPQISQRSQTLPLRQNQMSPLWQDGGPRGPILYDESPLLSRRNYANQKSEHQINWDSNFQPAVKSCYKLFPHKSLPQLHGKSWHSSWESHSHALPHGHSAPSLPALPLQSLPANHSHNNYPHKVHQHTEPPQLGQYHDRREQLFFNLCSIFPSDLVRIVMARNPCVLDAQELAAAILLEKSRLGS